MINIKSIKTQLIIYFAGLAIFLSIRDKDAIFFVGLIIALGASVVIESVILYLKNKAFRITESALITGLIVGFVLSSDQEWWKIVLASALAILSKYLIRFRKKHIFNPAAFGIFLVLVTTGATTQWKATYLWYIIIPFGLYFAHRIRKIELIFGYALVSLLLFAGQAILEKNPLWGIFGYYSYFYIFVMAIEPKTSTISKRGKFLFGAGLACFIFVFTQVGVRFDVELFSLLFMNSLVPLLNKLT